MRERKAPAKYDPSISSREYHEMACAMQKRRPSVSHTCESMLNDWYRFDLHERHLADLLNPENWRRERPRVFISSYANQSHNVEVRFAGGGPGIYFEKDFEPRFIWNALGGHGGSRSLGELFWMRRVFDLGGTDVDRMLLYGHKARLDEVIAQIRDKLDVVGSMPMSIIEDDGKPYPHFEADISQKEIMALWTESQAWRRANHEWDA